MIVFCGRLLPIAAIAFHTLRCDVNYIFRYICFLLLALLTIYKNFYSCLIRRMCCICLLYSATLNHLIEFEFY